MRRLVENYLILIYLLAYTKAKPIAFNTTFVVTQNENKTDLHLRLWLNDLISATFGNNEKNHTKTMQNLAATELPIYIEKSNAGQLEIQLEYLQSHGNDIQSKLNAKKYQENTIYLNQANAHVNENNIKPTKAASIEQVNEYTGDITTESSNVYKLINFPLVTTKIHIPKIEDKSNEEKTANTWINDKLATKQHDQQAAQMQANTLSLTKPQAMTLTATTTDGHLMQGNNINKQQFEFADQVNMFNISSQLGLFADMEHTATTTTAKNLILIEKTLTATKLNKVSNSNLNITSANDHNKPQLAIMGNTELAGNYMLANTGKYKNSKTNLTEIQQSFLPQIQHTQAHMQNDNEYENENELISMSTRPTARILHEDIGITINCVTFFSQPDDDKRIVENVKVQNGNEFHKNF